MNREEGFRDAVIEEGGWRCKRRSHSRDWLLLHVVGSLSQTRRVRPRREGQHMNKNFRGTNQQRPLWTAHLVTRFLASSFTKWLMRRGLEPEGYNLLPRGYSWGRGLRFEPPRPEQNLLTRDFRNHQPPNASQDAGLGGELFANFYYFFFSLICSSLLILSILPTYSNGETRSKY